MDGLELEVQKRPGTCARTRSTLLAGPVRSLTSCKRLTGPCIPAVLDRIRMKTISHRELPAKSSSIRLLRIRWRIANEYKSKQPDYRFGWFESCLLDFKATGGVVAIGGINLSNVRPVMELDVANLEGVAVVSALFDRGCVVVETRKLHANVGSIDTNRSFFRS